MDVDGSRKVQVTSSDAAEGKPSWFPDGERLAYFSNRDKTNGLVVTRRVDAARNAAARRRGPGARPLCHRPSSGDGAVAVLVPRRSLSRQGPDARRRLYTTPLSSFDPRPLGDFPESVGYPAWSPDERLLAVEIKEGSSTQAGIVELSTGRLRRLTRERGQTWVHSWSPDGRKIAVAALRDGQWSLRWIDVHTAEQGEITAPGSTKCLRALPRLVLTQRRRGLRARGTARQHLDGADPLTRTRPPRDSSPLSITAVSRGLSGGDNVGMSFEPSHRRVRPVVAAALFLCAPLAAAAQSQPPATPRVTLPPVVVTAQKEPDDIQNVPGSVTAVTADTLTDRERPHRQRRGAVRPEHVLHGVHRPQAQQPALPRHRRQPGATPPSPPTIDGVPQLNANSSSIELLDVEQIEFVRGPQSPLFGRNALGGMINVTQRAAVAVRTGPAAWSRRSATPSSREVRGSVVGPARVDTVGVSFSLGTAGPRRLHRQRGHRQRPRLAVRDLRQGPAALGAGAELGGPRHLHRRARPRRRLRAERPRRRCANDPFVAAARLRGLHPSRRSRTTVLAARRRRARRVHQQHRLRQLEDRGRHRSRLHAAAAGHARTTPKRICSSRRRCGWRPPPTPRCS